MEGKKAVSTYHAAEELGVSIRTVQQWMEKGILNGWKTPGGHRRVNADEVSVLAAKRRREGTSGNNLICKVLVIEDDPDICRLYEIMSRGWRIPTSLHFANDGLKGLIAIGEIAPDFVIVDLNIPLVDGFELIKTLNEKFDAQTFRCCVITGMTKDEISKRGQLPKDCPVMNKPIDFAALENHIANAYSEIKAKHSAITEK